MNGILSLKEIKELFRSEKKIKIALISGAVIILMIAFSGLSASQEKKAERSHFDYSEQAQYEEELEKKLSKVLSEVDGIGSMSIMITLDSSEENVYLKDDDELTSIRTPSVRGVIVVCDGGDDIIIREKVIKAVAGVFGISTTHISVIK